MIANDRFRPIAVISRVAHSGLMMDIEPWLPACAEYFAHFSDGRLDHEGRFWVIVPREEVHIAEDRGDLSIGRAGCDGIEFCFRRGMTGVWAYYPIDGEHVCVAPDLQTLERGWWDGSITV